MKRRSLAMVALVAVLAMVGAACSNDDNGGGDTTGATGTTGGSAITVGVSWNNYNEERWAKWDEPAIKDALAAGGADYISADAGSSGVIGTSAGGSIHVIASGSTARTCATVRRQRRASAPRWKPGQPSTEQRQRDPDHGAFIRS